MTVKNISTSTFNTFITTLRQEQKQGFMLVKFQHKAGFFCGTLSNEKEITALYKDTLAKTDENAKELVLKKIAEIVEAANGEIQSFVAEGEMDDPKEKIIPQDAPVEALEKEQDVVAGTYTSEDVRVFLNGEMVDVELSNLKVVNPEEKPKKQRRSRKAKSVGE